MVQRLVAWLRGAEAPQDDIPVCPMHDEPMVLFKKVGNPARFSDQQTETYTLIFRCPVPGCDESATRTRIRTQIPAPGETTERPEWARSRKSF